MTNADRFSDTCGFSFDGTAISLSTRKLLSPFFSVNSVGSLLPVRAK